MTPFPPPLTSPTYPDRWGINERTLDSWGTENGAFKEYIGEVGSNSQHRRTAHKLLGGRPWEGPQWTTSAHPCS
jgi:hypothetical protein